MPHRKNGKKTEGRNPNGTFACGNPGKPKGSRHKITRAVENLLEGSAELLTQRALAMALDGDKTALRICIDRIIPPKKDAPINFTIPSMTSAADASQAASELLSAVSQGLITPLEGAAVMDLIDQYRRTLETTELEARIQSLEERNYAT